MEEDAARVSENTKNEERNHSNPTAGADRAPTPEEESLAEKAAQQLEDSGELAEAAGHEKEMTRLGAEVKGEGEIS
jgi:hypothetical protein